MQTIQVRCLLLGAALALSCAAPVPRHPALPPDPAFAPVAFLSGSWSSENGGTRIEEHWTQPSGGLMLASGRTLRGGKAIFFEYLRIESTPAGLIYVAQPRGKQGTTFALKEALEGKVIFENLEHDFPKRITYTRRHDGAIDVRIDGDRDGHPAEEAWTLVPQ